MILGKEPYFISLDEKVESMYDLIMTIDKDTIIFNKGRRFHIDSTNLPLKDGLFSGDFYWKARVVSADESRMVLYADFESYNSTEMEFDQALDLPYSFNRIEFSNIDRNQISRHYTPNANLLIKNSKTTQEYYIEEGDTVHTRISHQGLSLTPNQTLCHSAFFNGEPIRIKLGHYDPSLKEDRYPFMVSHIKRVLGKETFDISITMRNGELYVQSEDVDKFLTPDHSYASSGVPDSDLVHEVIPKEPLMSLVEKKVTLSIKMSSLDFKDRRVSFSFKFQKYPECFNVEVTNTYLVPEFNHIKPFFCVVLGKKSIRAEISYRGKIDEDNRIHEVEILEAQSVDIDKIDPHVIKEAQRLCCVDHLLNAKQQPLTDIKVELESIIIDRDLLDPPVLIDTICEKKEGVKHALELKFLANRHESDFPLKFGRHISVTSFLFLVKGDHSYFLVLEAIDMELATYIWKCSQAEEELRAKIKEVESLVASFKENNRTKYIQSNPEDFYRINHKYQDGEQGFLEWQKNLTDLLKVI